MANSHESAVHSENVSEVLQREGKMDQENSKNANGCTPSPARAENEGSQERAHKRTPVRDLNEVLARRRSQTDVDGAIIEGGGEGVKTNDHEAAHDRRGSDVQSLRELFEKKASPQNTTRNSLGRTFDEQDREYFLSLKKAQTECESTQSKQDRVLSLLQQGINHFENGDLAKCIELFEQARVLAFEITNELERNTLLARALANMGTANLAMGNAEEAMDNCRNALQIVREINDSEREYTVLGNMAASAISIVSELAVFWCFSFLLFCFFFW